MKGAPQFAPSAALGLAAAYACIYSALIPVARAHGYALAIHGTMARDLDLIAVPWTEDAAEPLTLIKVLKVATATVTHTSCGDKFFPECEPTQKPHGRVSYTLHFTNRGGEGAYIDVSVMPRVAKNFSAGEPKHAAREGESSASTAPISPGEECPGVSNEAPASAGNSADAGAYIQ